jgi:hypothetical protein
MREPAHRGSGYRPTRLIRSPVAALSQAGEPGGVIKAERSVSDEPVEGDVHFVLRERLFEAGYVAELGGEDFVVTEPGAENEGDVAAAELGGEAKGIAIEQTHVEAAHIDRLLFEQGERLFDRGDGPDSEMAQLGQEFDTELSQTMMVFRDQNAK